MSKKAAGFLGILIMLILFFADEVLESSLGNDQKALILIVGLAGVLILAYVSLERPKAKTKRDQVTSADRPE